MLKRIFWLGVIAAGGWLIWQWLRHRQAEFGDSAPQLAPPRQYPPPADPDEALAPATPGAAPVGPPAIRLDAPEAPPAAAAQPDLDALFAGEAAPADSTPSAAQAPAHETPAVPAESGEQPAIVGYCMRCRTKRPIKDAHEETSESGRRAARGICPVCGTNMFTFLAANGDDRGASE